MYKEIQGGKSDFVLNQHSIDRTIEDVDRPLMRHRMTKLKWI